ncbi:MAG: ketopantoate reductase family protein [Lachnospiraceae bacterium]
MDGDNFKIGLIGLGVIGSPIANILYKYYKNNFYLIASKERKEKLKRRKIVINNERFSSNVISSRNELRGDLDLLIVCIKNYSLKESLQDFINIIGDKTVILPLQNGIYAYDFFCEKFKNNVVLRGYVQGPNTQMNGGNITYTNTGVMHIGKTQNDLKDIAKKCFYMLENAGIDIVWEDNIKKMVWKKWMLNVAGNSITALTLTDYSFFKKSPEIQELCIQAMNEFILVAQHENVDLVEKDIDDVINYYITYNGSKKTSMLEDMLNNRRTENEYLAGSLIRLAEKHGITTPMIRTLYLLIKIREKQYWGADNE